MCEGGGGEREWGEVLCVCVMVKSCRLVVLVTVTYCNKVTPLDQLPQIPTLWEEEEEEDEEERRRRRRRRRVTRWKAEENDEQEDTTADLVGVVSKVVCTVFREL